VSYSKCIFSSAHHALIFFFTCFSLEGYFPQSKSLSTVIPGFALVALLFSPKLNQLTVTHTVSYVTSFLPVLHSRLAASVKNAFGLYLHVKSHFYSSCRDDVLKGNARKSVPRLSGIAGEWIM
jgi:hypothetical protein